MIHNMHLNPIPFALIKNRIKTIELRLNDEKRKRIHVEDEIIFRNTENKSEIIKCKVIDLFHFDSFNSLYKELDLLKCGYTLDNIDNARAEDMEFYYSKNEQEKYGVVGISIQLL